MLKTDLSRIDHERERVESGKLDLILLTHPAWFGSQSMPRFARMIGQGMQRRGHLVQVWTAPQRASRGDRCNAGLQKWLGYVDQFLLYPPQLRRLARQQPPETLFVFTDHALGMWVQPVADRANVMHCHDFLAQRSALGHFPENPTSWTGKKYQSLIRRGFSKASNFISVSEATRQDLHRIVSDTNGVSAVVHNGLNGNFRPIAKDAARRSLVDHQTEQDKHGFLLHVGGNQWYKHRIGVLDLYAAWCQTKNDPLPLWMVGAAPSESLLRAAKAIPNGGHVRFLTGLSDEQVIAAYNLATVFLFPSLEEGFGWPIAEAMACGTPVLTTDKAPMTEVGGDAAMYIRRREAGDVTWARDGAEKLDHLLLMSDQQRDEWVDRGLTQANSFSTEKTLDAYESIYREIVGQR